MPIMPTFYQTTATPRGRRRKEESDSQSSSRPSGQSLHRLSKTLSRTSDERATSKGNRPASPVSPQNVSIVRSPSQKSITSHTPSTTSLDSQGSLPYLVVDVPGSFPTSAPGVQLQEQCDQPTLQPTSSETTVSLPQTLSVPPTATVDAAIPSNGPDNSPQVRSRKASSSSTAVTEAPEALQTGSRTVKDDSTPTPTPTKSPKHNPQTIVDVQTRAHAESPVAYVSQAANAGLVYHHLPIDPSRGEASHRSSPGPPAISPPHSPTMPYYGSGPVDYGPSMSPPLPQYPYPYPTHMPVMSGSGSFYPNMYYNNPFSRQFEEPQAYDINSQARSTRSGSEDDREQLLQKVSSVLPDIHRLLNEYKGTQGPVLAPELMTYHSQGECRDQLEQVKRELDATKKEYEKAINDLVGDRRKLEREVADLRQNVADLQIVAGECEVLKRQAACLEYDRKELADTKETFRVFEAEALAKQTAQANEIESLKSMLHSDRELHSCRISEIKEQHKDQLAAREKEHQESVSEHKSTSSRLQLELTALSSKHAAQTKELESCRSRENGVKLELDAKTMDLNNKLALHVSEIESMKKEWAQETGGLRAATQAAKDELERECRDHRKLQELQKREVDKFSQVAGAFVSCREKHAELQKEHENLDRILQGMAFSTVDVQRNDLTPSQIARP